MSQKEESEDENSILLFLINSLTDDRGQTQFCLNLIANLFEKRISPFTAEFPEVKIKRQNIDHYLKGICNLTKRYGIHTIEIHSPSKFHGRYLLQTDDVDIEFSKVFTEYIKNKQHQNSHRENSIFTNELFQIIYRYLSILEKPESKGSSPIQTSKHTTVRHEIAIFSEYLNTIRKNLTSNEVSQNVKHDLQKIVAWIIIDYFTHNVDLFSQARKNFGLQNSTDETVLAEHSDYVWDPEWSHPLFLNIPTYISSQAISTISINKDYFKVYPLTAVTTPLNYNSFLPDRIGNNSLNSTLIQQKNLNGNRNLTQQDIETPSHFTNEEVVTTVTTTQQSILPVQPNLTTPRPKNPLLPQITLQTTVKPSVVPKYSRMDHQTLRRMTKPTQKQRTVTRKNFAEHNYNYVNRPQTSKLPRTNTQNHLFSQRQNFQNPTTHSVNFHDYPRISQDQSENYQFFQQNKNNKQHNQNKHKTLYYTPNYLSSDDEDFYDQNQRLHSYHVHQPDIFEPYTQEQHTRQPRPNHASQNNNFYSQIPVNTDYYQPT